MNRGEKRIPGYLFVLPWYPESPIGGVNQALLNLIDLMNEEGRYRPFLLIPFGPENPPAAPHLHCTVFSLPLRAPVVPANPLRGLAAFLLTLPRTLYRLRGLIRAYDIRRVNSIFPDFHSFAVVVLRMLRLFRGKVILTLQGNDIKVAMEERGLARSVARLMFRKADFVVACSHGIRDDLLGLEPGCERNSVVIHNSIDIQKFLAESRGADILPEMPDGRFILNIGRYEYKKGQDVLIRAFEPLLKDFPDLFLVMLGAPGDSVDRIRELVLRSPACSRILMLENVPHASVPLFLRGALLFVLPSRREGLPFAILEAAACGRPVVAAAATGVPEVIRDRVTGLLVAVDDDAGLARAIREMIEDDSLRTEMAANLNEYVKENFTWRQAYRRYMLL